MGRSNVAVLSVPTFKIAFKFKTGWECGVNHSFAWHPQLFLETRRAKGQSANRSRGNRSRVRPETWVFKRPPGNVPGSLSPYQETGLSNELDKLENFVDGGRSLSQQHAHTCGPGMAPRTTKRQQFRNPLANGSRLENTLLKLGECSAFGGLFPTQRSPTRL